MSNDNTPASRQIVLERSYDAAVEALWTLWTTKDGFESWWGPEGFRVEVRALDPHVGGALCYDMIATAADAVEYMKREGMPLSHETRGTFVEVEPLERLQISHHIDFVPGVAPYENRARVEFSRDHERARMRITIDPHHDQEWTQRAAMGWESQLTKVPAALDRLGDHVRANR
ncbi:SRPBCC family protein [Haliangium sp.]|uniref:SRPBCC family protein n=1 Tax=Haliangium sp. TaxID=2663208 RepID=UPI003D0EF8DB